MDKIIPILPCPDVRAQAVFYEALGFEVTGIYTSPNPYLSLRRNELEIHFYGNRRMVPAENPSMCFLSVGDVDDVCQRFTAGMKQWSGKTPRSGIPRISKVRDLESDRRFTLVDPGGNTIFVGTPVEKGSENFFRTLENQEFAATFAVLYDLLYSKEDAGVAANLLPKLVAAKPMLTDLDRAKVLLVEMDIKRTLGLPVEEKELATLLAAHARGEDWKRIHTQLEAMYQT